MMRAEALSHLHGGHLIRRIRLATSILELDDVLAASKLSLRSEHIGAASLKLGELTATPKTSAAPPKFLNQRQKIAHEHESLPRHFSPRMVSSHIGGVLLGLSRSQHQLTDSCLDRLAARCIADNSQRLSVASNSDVKTITKGFSHHRYRNTLLWEVLSSELLKRPNLEPAYMSSILLDVPRDLRAHEGIRRLVKELSASLAQKIEELPPGKCVSLLTWSTKLPPDLSEETRPLVHALMAKGEDLIARIPPQQVAVFVSALLKVPMDLISLDVKRAIGEWIVKESNESSSSHIQEVEQDLKRLNIS